MKTILIPTDFSSAAFNALEYGYQMAKIAKAKIILMHAYQYPIIPSETPMIVPIQELEKDSLEALKIIKNKIQSKYGEDVLIDTVLRCGFAVDEINEYTEKHKTDLIVIGMSGSGFIDEKIIGSTTTSLIKKSKCPVLVIENEAKFQKIKNIALASDYNEMKNKTVLNPLKNIAELFDSHIHILHVDNEIETAPSSERGHAISKLDHTFSAFDHSFHTVKSDDIIEGIIHFTKENNIDLVVMIPRERTILRSIFHNPNTKRMAFHSKTPLLALHE